MEKQITKSYHCKPILGLIKICKPILGRDTRYCVALFIISLILFVRSWQVTTPASQFVGWKPTNHYPFCIATQSSTFIRKSQSFSFSL